MKIAYLILVGTFVLLTACVTDKHSYTQNPQKIFNAVNTKYPADKNTLVFIDAPSGFVAPSLANSAVGQDIDNGKVVAIISSLALKTSTVITAGEDETLTATTLAKALSMGKDKINGSKAIVIDAKGAQNKTNQKTLADLATASGVSLGFIAVE